MTEHPAPARKVLLLGEDARMVLASARSLGRKGIDVRVGWCPDSSPALRSRYVTRAGVLPLPGETPDWAESLRRHVEREGYALVLPCTEAALVPLQADYDRWSKVSGFHLIEPHAFETFADKRATSELAASLGIATPATVILEVGDELSRVASTPLFPLIVKPERSVSADASAHKNYVRRVENMAALESAVARIRQRGVSVLLQEFLKGHGVGVELLAHEGSILTALQHVRLHETNGHGSTYRASVALEPRLLGAAESMVKALGFTGLAMAEFRVDEDSGAATLLEVNARLWGSLPLAVAAGADFPYYLFQMLVDGKRELPRTYRTGVRCRNLFGDARWMMRNLSNRESGEDPADEQALGWDVNRVGKWRLTKDFLRAACFVDRVDTFGWDDPRPGLTDSLQLAKFIVRRPLRKAARFLSGKRKAALER